MKNYVISLNTAIERRKHIIHEFGKQDITFEFFDAITTHQLDEVSKQLGLLLFESRRLSAIEKACFLSHISLWQKMIDNNLEYIAIFEDDIYLGKNADNFLINDQWILNNLIHMDIIKLETSLEKTHCSKKEINYRERSFSRLKNWHTGAAAYIISNKGAKILLQHIRSLNSEDFIALDHMIFDKLLSQTSVYQISPALSIQSTFLEADNPTLTSNLEAGRLEHRKGRLKDPRDLKHYLKKMKRSIGKRILYTTVLFE